MSLNNWRVLIVEDEYDSQQMVSKILSHHGVDIYLAGNGNECLDMIEDIEPTIVVTDLAMPDMDGWEMLMAVRSNPTTAHIPVVAMTAFHSANVAEDAIHAGFNAYFPKPVDPNSFVDSLAEIVG